MMRRNIMEKLLELLEQDCTMPISALAAAAGLSRSVGAYRISTLA